MTTGEELDELASSYYLDPPADVWLEERVQAWILPKIIDECWTGGRARVLEMGYGTGIVAKALVGAGLPVDILEGSRRLAREAFADLYQGWGGRIVEALFEDFDPGPVYDVVLALHVLEHVESPVRMLERILGWLKPGGRLVAVTPNAESIHRRLGSRMTGQPVWTLSERDHLVGHRRVFTLRELVGDVRAVGFDYVAPFGWFLKPVHNALMVDWAPELIDALCAMGYEGNPVDAANIGVVAEKKGH